jgi:hypothetical protein
VTSFARQERSSDQYPAVYRLDHFPFAVEITFELFFADESVLISSRFSVLPELVRMNRVLPRIILADLDDFTVPSASQRNLLTSSRHHGGDRSMAQDEVYRHLAPWRQKLLTLLKEAGSAPDRPPQESDDGDHPELERSASEARRGRAGRNKKPI